MRNNGKPFDLRDIGRALTRGIRAARKYQLCRSYSIPLAGTETLEVSVWFTSENTATAYVWFEDDENNENHEEWQNAERNVSFTKSSDLAREIRAVVVEALGDYIDSLKETQMDVAARIKVAREAKAELKNARLL